MTETLPKDVYLYLMNFADDRTILNMLSVNKKFNQDEFFIEVLKRRYPATIQFKPDNLSWKQYYLEVIACIDKISREFDYKYSVNAKKSPKEYYNLMKARSEMYTSNKWEFSLRIASYMGDIDLVNYYLTKVGELYEGEDGAAQGGHLDILKYLISLDKNPIDYSSILTSAVVENHRHIIDFALANNAGIRPGFQQALYQGDKELVIYLIERGANINAGLEYIIRMLGNPHTQEKQKIILREMRDFLVSLQ